MKKPQYLYFMLEEYQQRLDALRARMAKKGVDAMLVFTPENLYYLTGFDTLGYLVYNVLIVPMEKDLVFITRGSEAAAVDLNSIVADSRPWHDSEDWIAKTKDTLVDLGLQNKRIGVEYDSLCALISDYFRLKDALPQATFSDCSGLVEQGRVIKSPQEIAYMREAADITLASIEAGVKACRVGATENDVAAEMYRVQIQAGSEWAGYPMFIKAGHRTLIGHAHWDRKRLEAGEILDIEAVACVRRYHASKWAQVSLGEPSRAELRAMEAAVAAAKAGRDVIKAGVTSAEVFNAIRETAESYGLGKEPDQRVGYSIGIAFPPDWGEGHIISIKSSEERPLQAGMTFHMTGTHAIHWPGTKNPMHARCSDTILVTETGCETLTDGIERKLFVA